VEQVVEHLPSKCAVLSSNPSTAKKQEQKMFGFGFGFGLHPVFSWADSGVVEKV
jgi:hypothetical protein